MDGRLLDLLGDLDRIAGAEAPERADCFGRAEWVRSATEEEIRGLFDALLRRAPPASEHEDALVHLVLGHIVARGRGDRHGPTAPGVGDQVVEQIVELYRRWEPGVRARNRLPCVLASERSPAALRALAELMADDPPDDSDAIASIFAPLLQNDDYDPRLLFPRLLDALKHASAAAVALDYMNYLVRQRRMEQHPATERRQELASLLGAVVGRLGQLESLPPDEAEDAAALSKRVNEGVALAVSLCDALALIGDRSLVGKLYQALELGHRRLRAEAAAALARLGEEAGAEALVALAAEPVARLRVLAYCDELGIADRVEERYKTADAKAEAELALWLAQPSQMGIPPTRCELIERRRQHWPGYETPVECFLFRFTYKLGDAEYSNIGITGPLVHAFGADLSDLPPDDIYAAFAGWQAQHEEIYELDVNQLDGPQNAERARLEARLRSEGCDAIQPVALGHFLGQWALVARTVRHGRPGIAVMDADRLHWFPAPANRRPPGPAEIYCIYKGRKLLRTFNPRD